MLVGLASYIEREQRKSDQFPPLLYAGEGTYSYECCREANILQFQLQIVTVDMSSPANRPCVLSRKRQHNLNDKYEVEDIVLSTSHLAKLDETIAEAKKLKRECSATSQNTSPEHSDSEGENSLSEDSEGDNVTTSVADPDPENADVPVADVTAASEKAPNSPQPGPSRYEDITFEPAVTSTPHHYPEDGVEPEVTSPPHQKQEDGVEKQEDQNETAEIDYQARTKHAKDFILQIEKKFVEDVKISIRKQTEKHILKLTERRIQVSKAIANAKKDIKRLETMCEFLSNHKNDIDIALNKFNYLIDRYPY